MINENERTRGKKKKENEYQVSSTGSLNFRNIEEKTAYRVKPFLMYSILYFCSAYFDSLCCFLLSTEVHIILKSIACMHACLAVRFTY